MTTTPPDPADFVARGMEAHREGATSEALAAYDEALTIDTGQPDVHFLRALVHLDLGDAAACLEDLGAAIDLAPRVADYRLVRAELLLEIDGRPQDALADLEAARAADPKAPQVHRTLARAYRRTSEWKKAVECLFTVSALAPDDTAVRPDLVETLAGFARSIAEGPFPVDAATDLEKTFTRALVIVGQHPNAKSAYAEFLLAWSGALLDSDPVNAGHTAEKALSFAVDADLRARIRSFLTPLQRGRREEARGLESKMFRAVLAELRKDDGGPSLGALARKAIEAARRRRRALEQPDRRDLERRREEEVQTPWKEKEELARHRCTFHPYLGYVQRPTVESWGAYSNNHGFQMKEPWADYPYNGEQGDDVIVAIFGGSVAHQFFEWEHGRLRDHVAAHLPAGDGREVTVLNFSQGGFGQPQALLSYFYFRSIGQRFDIVLNIDGFNEAMGKRTNQINGYHVSLPLSWMMNNLMLQFQTPSHDSEVLDFMGRLLRTQARVAELERKPDTWLSRWRLKRAREELADLRSSTPVVAEDRLEEPIVLPRTPPVDERVFASSPRAAAVLAEEVVDLWLRSSLLLGQGCAADGARYLHALQPNPYYWNKKLTKQEEAHFHPGSAEYWAIRQTYPAMLTRAVELIDAGIDFVDLTHCLDHEEDTLAKDVCHVNRLGNDLMFDALAPKLTALAQSLSRRKAPW